MKYDVVIPSAVKDWVKLPYCVRGLEQLNPQPENIYVISSSEVKIPGTTYIHEDDATPIKKEDLKCYRPNWIYQQLLKLYQNFTDNDNYFFVDSDIFFNKRIDMFDPAGNPYYYVSSFKQNHRPYFEFNEKVLGLKKFADYSFIADCMMFNRNIAREILPEEKSAEFVDKINKYTCMECIPAEQEIYGNYLLSKGLPVHTKDVKVKMYGKYMPELYTSDEIKLILSYDHSEYDIISVHSWT